MRHDRKPEVVTRLDLFATKEGHEQDPDFMEKTQTQVKSILMDHHVGSKEKKCPVLSATPKVAQSLQNYWLIFLVQMDALDLFPREEDGPKPFLLLDGHGSRLELPFLEYINDPTHQWVICIGVPYGTSYWQVGDSSEQNGSYKMALTKCKKELVLKKQKSCFKNPCIETYEIVIIVNQAWKKSFE